MPSLPALSSLLLLAGCTLSRPLTEPAWSTNRAGRVGVLGRLGVWADYEAPSTVTFESNFGFQEFDLDNDLEGELGAVLGLEVFVHDDVSLLFGYDYRKFEPDELEGFVFDDVVSQELFLAVRWVLPWRWGAEERWRAFVEAKVGYLPRTRFDAEIDLSSINQPNPDYVFAGSPYWNAGLSVGVLYQVSDSLVGQFSILTERALTKSEDDVVVDFLGTPLGLDTELEPEGTLALVGFTYYF